MKTTFDLVNTIYTALFNSAMRTAISGSIYKQQRPLDSTKEDVVINALPITGDQLQSSIININIHVPNLLIESNGKQDNTQPNLVKLKSLTDLVIAAVNNTYGVNFNYSVQQQTLIQDIDDYYSNIRVQFNLINNSNN
jgi:hypothetical protein